MRSFESLSEQEILALAIALEEEDERVYADFVEAFRKDFPGTASMFDGMREEESAHRRRLIELYRSKFGEHIPLIRRGDVKGLVSRKPIWLMQPLRPDAARRQAATLEVETRIFYEKAASRTQDASIRQLLNDLAQEEREHEHRAEELGRGKLDETTRSEEEQASRRLFVLQIVQPGLAGLMDRSVSTLAPVFTAAFARHESHLAFLVGLAASVGAGISMGFAEALGRGQPRGSRPSLGALLGLRLDDDDRRRRTSPAVPDSLIPDCRHGCGDRGGSGTCCHSLGTPSLYGVTVGFRDAPGSPGRSHGVCRWGADWKFVITIQPENDPATESIASVAEVQRRLCVLWRAVLLFFASN